MCVGCVRIRMWWKEKVEGKKRGVWFLITGELNQYDESTDKAT
jgi:hypothetical protein